MLDITIEFLTITKRRIDGRLPANFELNDLRKVIDDKVSDIAIEIYEFLCNGEQLQVNDPAVFETQKYLITDGVTIQLAKPINSEMSSDYPQLDELIDRILTEVGSTFDRMSSRVGLECAICIDKINPYTEIVCIQCAHVSIICRDDFIQHFKEGYLTFKCLKCNKIIEHKQVFANSPAFLKLLALLKEIREIKRNIDCQICLCGEFQINDTLDSKHLCEKCKRWFCFFCDKTWDDTLMTNDKFTCHNNCEYENRIKFEMIPMNPDYTTDTIKYVPSKRSCPKCFQASDYDNRCKMHTCDDCNITFCFICLRSSHVCLKDPSHCLPVRLQEYTMFPKTTDV